MILILKCLLHNYVGNNLNKPKKLFVWRSSFCTVFTMTSKYVGTLNLVPRA